jgi:hypothetical protein
LFHPEDRQKEVNPALFQFKSFLIQPCVIILIFNWLGSFMKWAAFQPPVVVSGVLKYCRALFSRHADEVGIGKKKRSPSHRSGIADGIADAMEILPLL